MPVAVNLQDVLRVCVRSALAAQQYIAQDLLKLSALEVSGEDGSNTASSILELDDAQKQQLVHSLTDAVSVDVKSELDYKEGEASHDLVTTADVLTQAVVVKALTRAFPDSPFIIVGEEEADATDKDPVMAAMAQHCMEAYYKDSVAMPCEAAFTQHLAAQTDASAQGIISADTLEALRARVSVYIDPIDGTNCFVTGVWQSPMTLIGITIDGVPLAAVVNRVFVYPIGLPEGAAQPTGSVSYVWNVTPAVAGSAFMVHEGRQVPLNCANEHAAAPKPEEASAVLRVTQSSTTKASFLSAVSDRLQPSVAVPSRGAGNKFFIVIETVLAEVYGVEQQRHGDTLQADAFICPGHTIKKWDTCAPHAFLYALGGDVFNSAGVPVRYPFRSGDDPFSPTFSELPDPIVAARKEALATVAARLAWPHP